MSNPDVKFILTYIDHVLAPNVRVQDKKEVQVARWRHDALVTT